VTIYSHDLSCVMWTMQTRVNVTCEEMVALQLTPHYIAPPWHHTRHLISILWHTTMSCKYHYFITLARHRGCRLSRECLIHTTREAFTCRYLQPRSLHMVYSPVNVWLAWHTKHVLSSACQWHTRHALAISRDSHSQFRFNLTCQWPVKKTTSQNLRPRMNSN